MKKLVFVPLILYICAVIFTTVFFVPKYAEYVDLNTIQRISTGYYKLSDLSLYCIYNMHYPNGTVAKQNQEKLNLQIDYPQWGMITFAESVLFLLPFIILYKRNYIK